MFLISIPQADIPSLQGDGCNVKINGQPVVLRREGEYLCYGEKRCKILDEHVAGENVQFSAASHEAEDEPHFIIGPDFTEPRRQGGTRPKTAASQGQGVVAIPEANGVPVHTTDTSIEGFLNLHSGEANAESPHLVVPFYMPLAPSMSFEDVLSCVDDDLRQRAKDGKIDLIAIAHGTMCEGERSDPLQLILLKDRQGYWTFGTFDGLIEMAVLMDGDGRRYLKGRKLRREEAVRQWMSGFLSWNCKCPGLYRLRYAMIEPAKKTEKESTTNSE